jgi:PKD repeat protein
VEELAIKRNKQKSEKDTGKRIACILIGLIFVGIIFIPGSALADWKNRATLVSAPASAYITVSTTFQYTLSNTGTTSFDTVSIEIIYDWMTAGLSYQPTPQVVGVPPGGSHTWDITIIVPSVTTGAHTATVNINAKGGEDLWASTKTWTMTHQIVAIQPLDVAISANPTSGITPLPVSFTTTVSGGLEPYTYSWAFGDSGTSTQKSPTHTYTTPGTFTATLIVQDTSPTPKTKSVTTSLTVSSPALAATISASPTSGIAPLPVSFTSTVSGGLSPYSYSWAFGDTGTSIQSSPSHTYSTSGTFTATLTVTDSSSTPKTKSATTTVTVSTTSLIVSFDSTLSNSGNGLLPLDFTSSVSGGLAPYTYSWDFGDGTSSTLPSPSHSYTSPGTYTVTLTVTDSSSPQKTSYFTEERTAESDYPSWMLLIIVIIIIVVIIGIVAAIYLRKRKQPPMYNQHPQQYAQQQPPQNQQPPYYPPPPPPQGP